MKEQTRNLAVGLTVIVALAMLGALILLFAGLPEMFQSGRKLHLAFDQTHDVRLGDSVYLAGIDVGKVTDISFSGGDPRAGVLVTVRINADVKVPADVEPQIYTRGFVGGAYLALVPGGPPRRDPATGKALQWLPEDWREPLAGVHKGSGLLPDELVAGLKSLSKLAASIEELIAPPAAPATGSATAVATSPAGTQPAAGNLRQALASMGRALDDLHAVLGNPDNQANLQKALANLATATGKASEAMDALKSFAAEAGKTAADTRTVLAKAGQAMDSASTAATRFAELADHTDRRVEELSEKLIDDAEKLSLLLSAVQRVATALESGQGSAGKFLNDPKLYQNLADAGDQLSKFLQEFRELLAEWKKSGSIPLKLK